MVPNNSQCEFYLAVLCGIYHDMVSAIVPQREIKRDLMQIRKRFDLEGFGFLTKTLPSLGKAIDRSLASSTKLQFSGFRKAPGTQLPAFAGGLISLLFDNEGEVRQAKPDFNSRCESVEQSAHSAGTREGPLSPDREIEAKALKALRQILYLCYKIEIPYNEDQVNNVVNTFVDTDRALPRITPQSVQGIQREVLEQSRKLIARVLCNSAPSSGIPNHGPGAVSTGEQSPEKHRFKRFYRHLDRVFKYDHWFYLNMSHVCESNGMSELEPQRYAVAKVVLVPKDSRGPRLISSEPLEMQWVQQALMSTLVRTLEQHRLTSGHINFVDQTVNRNLALAGSIDGKLATLDLKEASDRVGLRLVKALFPPVWFEALYASRSQRTKLPDGRLITLKKFAPMGSAVCFPVEALIFWAISVSALMIHKQQKLCEASASLFVYGDDIVCRTEDHGVVISALESFGLLVNRDKCCTTGFFKESCGMDAFNGIAVTPLKLRKLWQSSPKPGTIASYVAFSNAMYERGCVVTAEVVERFVKSLRTPWKVPTIASGDSAIVCFTRPDQKCRDPRQEGFKVRKNKKLHRLEVRGFTIKGATGLSTLQGYPLLLRLLAKAERRDAGSAGCDFSNPAFPGTDPTGYFPIAHREKPTRAWTRIG